MATLPDEIILQILSHTDGRTVFTSVSRSSKQLRRCSLTHIANTIVPMTYITTLLNLGPGHHRRWFSVNPWIIFCFSHIDLDHPGQAYFRYEHVHPSACTRVALEKWPHLRAHDKEGRELSWRAMVGRNGREGKFGGAVVVDRGDDELWVTLDWMRMLRGHYADGFG
nr:hypothetical protein B0A51_13428 [Rachicladosporium sp. CCFEE 5018]